MLNNEFHGEKKSNKIISLKTKKSILSSNSIQLYVETKIDRNSGTFCKTKQKTV